MLNEVHLEGIVVSRWRYGNTHFMRLAVYSDFSRGGRRDENYGRSLPDYAVLRCEGVYALVAANLPERARVSVSGRLISHQREMPLAQFLQRAKGNEQTLQALRAQSNGAVNVSYMVNEVLVERMELLPGLARDGQHATTAITASASGSAPTGADAPAVSNTLEPTAAEPIA